MKNLRLFVAICVFTSLSAFATTNLWTGLVSYWPLDDASTGTTPDIYFGNNMTAVASPTSIAGKRTNALVFNGTSQYIYVAHSTNNTDTGLPIYRGGTYSVAMWVKGAAQTAKYIFTEANNAGNTSPLFILQTGNAAANNSKLDILIRNDAGTTLINHIVSTAVVFDNNWHHIAWVDVQGQPKLYVDGVLDAANFKYNYADPTRSISLNTTAIGALARATTSGFFNGQVDDVAVWERALSQSEIQDMMTNSLQTPIPPQAPTFTTQPVSQTKALGDWVAFTASVVGFRPFSYQWQRNGQNIPNATDRSLMVTGLTTANSGESYTVNVSCPGGPSPSAPAVLTVLADPQPNIASGLISYWPFDNVTNVVTDTTNYWATADLYSGNSMFLNAMTDANLAAGQVGQALTFDGFTQYTARMGGFPIYNNTNYSVSLWVNAQGQSQNDRRMFAEGSTSSASPLWGIGTTALGQDSFARLFIRSDAGSVILDRVSTRPVFDGAWHHLAWVDRNGQGKLYVDGVLDESDFSYTRTNLTVNTTAVGALLRAAGGNNLFGTADEVSMWNRALTLTEIQQVMTNGIPHPVAATPPSLTRQPVGASVFSSSKVVLVSESAGTSPLYYQWTKNGANVSGATNASLTLNNVQVSDSGSYTMVITNVAGSVTSDVAVVSVTQRPAPPTSLAIDFDDRTATSFDTQPGFQSFILTGTGGTTVPTTYLFGGVEATLTSVGGAPLDTRKRGTPGNTDTFTLEKIFQDFVFANQATGTNGLALTVKYLDPNQNYNVTIYSYDNASAGSRMSDWYANGTFIQTWTFDGNVLPTSDTQYTFNFPVASDSNGTLQIQGLRNPGSATQGVFLNALRIDVAQLRIRSTQLLGNGDLSMLIDTPNVTQEHRVQQTTSLVGGSWTDVSNGTITPVSPGVQQLQAQFTPDPGTRFYRIVRIVP